MKSRDDSRHAALRRWALALALLCATTPTLAESGTGDRAADMMFDLILLRPLGLLATGAGSVIFVVALPFTLPSGSAGDAACELVRRPFNYTFSRPLGDMDADDSRCRDGVKR